MRLLLLALLLATAACSSAEPAEPDRLAILDENAVITIDPDGANEVTIAETETGSFFQPTWSPDRSLIAFSLIAEQPALYVARPGDGAVFTTEMDTFPFFFSWSSQLGLGMLRAGSGGIQLETTSLIGDEIAAISPTESGAPLYFSWSPDGASLAAHIGTDRLLTSDLTTSTDLAVAPGSFSAPVWTDVGIMAVVEGGVDGRLVVSEASGEVRTIATVPGAANFIPNRDSSLIAIQALRSDQSAQSAAFQEIPRVPSGRLVVVAPDTGEITQVTEEPALAFFWSPLGDKLLVLDIVPGPLARWQVWSEDGLEELTTFIPNQRFFSEVLPFFDQYAQSLSLWSPDGTRIAFPGTIDDQSGIWLQSLDGEPEYLRSGSWVSWAP